MTAGNYKIDHSGYPLRALVFLFFRKRIVNVIQRYAVIDGKHGLVNLAGIEMVILARQERIHEDAHQRANSQTGKANGDFA